ncbi:homoserine kinase [Alkalihalobacillus xiaoxiensis]|uniref:Homoserine kinase n=1 Tax=Shouchella xiaoxiensis TaxID=766895 RepID=A0ABS2SS00_9BACI|nr:homoserine kinase [Shouchella xiaoxiensis]MBM7838294.1 homoserine kinase [Shouchella xiaoxiensis]
MMFSITVPASTANLGPGFDSIGLALNKYLYLEGSQAEQWVFECDSPGLTNLKPTNLITEAASFASKHFGSSLPPCHVKMENEIPLAKGFGSSAAATVAGIELASYFCRSAVSKADKARIASLWEGHPDNVAASIYGGLVIGAHRQDDTDIIHIENPEVEMVAVIPSETLATKKARALLPKKLDFSVAVEASALANVVTAACVMNNWKLAGKLMMEDQFHQPYRNTVVPEMDKLFQFAKEDSQIFGAALSGAGPILLCFVEPGATASVAYKVNDAFPTHIAEEIKPALLGSAISVAQA